MTNTESRNVRLAEFAPWDEANALENDEQITEADIRELAVYAFDSDKQTLVGLGPVERARRARKAAENPDSQRMPQFELPGPFIAVDAEGGDEGDAELVRSLRGGRLGPWAMVVAAVLVIAAAALAVMRGFAPHVPPAGQAVLAANTSPALRENVDAVSADRAQVISANQNAETAPVAERPDSATRSVPVKAPPGAAAALPVPLTITLPEQPPPTVAEVSPVDAAASVGSLSVTSTPPANVLLDGRPLGKAPCLVQVPAGIHAVLFIHPLYGRRSLSVNVGAGQTTTASVDF